MLTPGSPDFDLTSDRLQMDLGLKEDVTRKILRENDFLLFKLESGKPLVDETVDIIPIHA